MKIGFLLPRSTVYPLIGFDFLDGFKSFLQHLQKQDEIAIITENIGFGLDEEEVYSKNEKLLLADNVDVVVAFVDGRCAEMLTPLYTATGKILILVNMGAHYNFDDQLSPNIIHHTYNTAFNTWLTGQLAAIEENKKAAMATSFYDGGYLQCFTMVNSFMQNGGQITSNFVSHFKPEEFDITPLKSYLENDTATTALLCLYSGDVSHLMYQALSNLQQTLQLNLYLSPMMLDEFAKQKIAGNIDIKNAKGYTTWHSSLPNENNIIFKKQFTALSSREASIFAMLGWEAGILVNEIIQLKPQNTASTIVQALQNKELASPRGWIKLDAETNHTYSPSYLFSNSGNFNLSVENTFSNTEEEKKKFIQIRPDANHSSWRNTYLCS
jgi:branched-chain amino acid transport system substrate-binding protein